MIHLLKNNHSGVPLELDLELLAGLQAEFRTRVHGNGNLLIGHAYTRRLGLEPGQEFKIELQRDSGMIVLQQMDQDQP